jgi:hypothetical protein
VLPYSSTTGIEGVLLGCELITHTECCYDTMLFANRAADKTEYFQMINEGLVGQLHKSQQYRDDAFIAFMCILNDRVVTAFREQITQWLGSDIVQVNCMEGVEQIIDIIAENIPAVYQNIRRILEIERN